MWDRSREEEAAQLDCVLLVLPQYAMLTEMGHLWPSSLLGTVWHAGEEGHCLMVQGPGREVMVKLYAQQTALVTWLPPTHVLFQFITITAINALKRNPRYAPLDVFDVSLWPCSPSLPLSFPFARGLFGLFLCRESPPQIDIPCAGSWKPLQRAGQAMICLHVGSTGFR